MAGKSGKGNYNVSKNSRITAYAGSQLYDDVSGEVYNIKKSVMSVSPEISAIKKVFDESLVAMIAACKDLQGLYTQAANNTRGKLKKKLNARAKEFEENVTYAEKVKEQLKQAWTYDKSELSANALDEL